VTKSIEQWSKTAIDEGAPEFRMTVVAWRGRHNARHRIDLGGGPRPASAMVGTAGSSGERVGVVTAEAAQLLAATMGATDACW